MKKRVPNFAIYRPLRTMRDLPSKARLNLLRQMRNYLYNCEVEDKSLRTFKQKVNS
jgi:hypothetical protein